MRPGARRMHGLMSAVATATFVTAIFVTATFASAGLVLAGSVGPAHAATGPAISKAALANAPLTRAESADARIAIKLKARLKNPALGRDVAVRVYDPGTGRTVFASQSNEPQLPASNMKVVTAFTALTTLGPDAVLATRVLRGPTTGSIVVVGGGDPLLSSADLRSLAARTVAALTAASPSHTRPTGLKVSVDDSLFPRPTRAAGWTSSYGLGDISPIRSLARHGVAATDTTSDAMAYFIAQLQRAGIAIDYLGRTVTRAAGLEVAQVAGHRIEQDVQVMLGDSDNQIAETLFRQVALSTGRTATWAGASAAARSVLTKSNVSLVHTRFVDGSGLSRSNRITAAALVKVLRLVSVNPSAAVAAFVPSLPVAGRTGTLKGRFVTPPTRCAARIVKAKTGFINGVVALSGVARGADGKLRVFSIVANHVPSSRYSVNATQLAIDKLAATITGCY